MRNNARFDQPEMALAAYEAWMALEECEKYRLISDERSAEHVGGDHPSVGGRVVTLEEQGDVMRVMARVCITPS